MFVFIAYESVDDASQALSAELTEKEVHLADFQLNVRFKKETLVLEALLEDLRSVFVLRERLSALVSIPANNLRVIFKGRVLPRTLDRFPLKDAGLESGATMTLMGSSAEDIKMAKDALKPRPPPSDKGWREAAMSTLDAVNNANKGAKKQSKKKAGKKR